MRSTLSAFAWHVKRRLAYNAALREKKTMRVIQKALTFDDVLLVPAHSTRPAPRSLA